MTITNIADLLDGPTVNSGLSVVGQVSETQQAPVATASTPLRLSVTWGDISQVRADIHIAGHYQGVVPARAERALDEAVSSTRRVVQEHTRRGWLVGALGEVAYFPASDVPAGRPVRRIAVAGMGRLGTFTESRASQMYASLLGELLGLDSVKRAATVLIGSGAGNLTVAQATRALVAGFSSATGTTTASLGCLNEVVVAEIDRLRAEQVRLALDRWARQVPSLIVEPEISRANGGQVGVDSAAVFAICGLARLVQDTDRQPAGARRGETGPDPVGALLKHVPNDYRAAVREKLCEISDDYTALAVVIGDPGDPLHGHGLPAAREEAREVEKVLREHGFSVRLFLGMRGTDADGAEPATQLDVLKELLGRKYHVIHYAGHGTFDPENPRRTGWLFADGVLGARELAQLTRAPRLVVANACWSAARPGPSTGDQAGQDTTVITDLRTGQAALTPVLADEFLRVGVVHYVGTSWRVPDELARRFARIFYDSLLSRAGGGPQTVGQAMRAAREGLFFARGPEPAMTSHEQWSAWAAYQHYGDPHDTFELEGHQGARRARGGA